MKLDEFKVGDIYEINYEFSPVFFCKITSIDPKSEFPIIIKLSRSVAFSRTDRVKPMWFCVNKTRASELAWELFG